ncbi:uncharacterized protein SCHCODRAFT_02304647 [Schizophyllum commune H4-8]|uniref:Expressed protein n=1 Tax=Schizophyllum commune (strain H4-8 / FGSC 9210) TaxID=578458 RepID=D8Q3T3_SCHCM|nr:uncharacterized protein SCHCODRAFT_02304647 [Schizophyllum commune H4-8]KAI5892904.1 hypothetical protein SCHCODRAFT_02304647 [Schizophyllum commune H4-8]
MDRESITKRRKYYTGDDAVLRRSPLNRYLLRARTRAPPPDTTCAVSGDRSPRARYAPRINKNRR